MNIRFGRIILTALLVIGLATALSSTAFANLSGSTFEGSDGNMVVDTTGNLDWANVNTVTPLHIGVDNSSGSSDNAFGQGTKEDNANVSVVDGSIPPNKNDLTRFYEASQQASNGDIYLYLGWERLVNIGNANLDFEINQNATAGFTGSTTGPLTLNRTAGDLLVSYDFGGSGTPTLGLNTWLTAAAGNTVSQCFSANALPCWGLHVTLNGSNSEGAVNSAPIQEPFLNTTLGTGLFGEAAINLTTAGVFKAGVCEAFGSTFVKSRSSSSFTAEIKDFIAPVEVNISNCGSITVHKVTENGDSSFGYTTTGLTPSSFSLSNGGSTAYQNLPAGNYSVTENLTNAQVAAGWTFKSLTCTPNVHVTVTGTTATIALGQAENVDCTYTNHINLSPTIATTLSATTVNVGTSVHDSATLSGATATAGGTVTYHAYAGANTCTGTDLLNSTVTVTNGVVPDSSSVSFANAGFYSFQAVYSGDSNNNGASSACSTEQLLVKTNPTISTTLSATTVNIGVSVHDSAALSGATGDAGGTVTYHAYAGANTCTGTDLLNSQVTVTNGAVPDSGSISFQNAGTYSFQAVYSGDTKNNGATSDCTTEQVVVSPNNPGISTAQNLLPNDKATISGATSNAGGTVTFKLFSPSDATCAAAPAFSQTVNVNGNGDYLTTNTTFLATAEGTWRWLVVYSGDNNNVGATLACGVEQFTIANH
jgi:hypothetical protein